MGYGLWIARYLLNRVVAEQWGVNAFFHLKPLQGDWNGCRLPHRLFHQEDA